MNFLATVAILTVAAKISISDFKLTSDPFLCESAACSRAVETLPGILVDLSLIERCINSVSIDCRFTATVHIQGSVSYNKDRNFQRHHDYKQYIVKVAEFILPWGSFAKNPEFTGIVQLATETEIDKLCSWFIRPWDSASDHFKFSEVSLMAKVFKITTPSFDYWEFGWNSVTYIGDQDEDTSKANFNPELFVRRLQESKYDFLFLNSLKEGISKGCGDLMRIEFLNVSWKARFEGFGASRNCSINASPIDFTPEFTSISGAAADNDACSAILLAAAATNDGCSAIRLAAAAMNYTSTANTSTANTSTANTFAVAATNDSSPAIPFFAAILTRIRDGFLFIW